MNQNLNAKNRIIAARRSQTITELPNINKTLILSSHRSNRKQVGLKKQHKSTYIDSVKQIAGNLQYSQLNLRTIHQQQKKLKQILQDINKDTIKLLDDVAIGKLSVSPKKNADFILKVRDRQVFNNNKIIDNCQVQIQKLNLRSGIVLGNDKNYFHNKIKSVTNEIQQMIAENRSLKWQNYKRGQSIVKITNGDQQLHKLLQQNQQINQKLNRLKNQDIKVHEEIISLIDKCQEIKDNYKKAESYFQKISKNPTESPAKTLQSKYNSKKSAIQSLKYKKEINNSNLQLRYLRCLKNIDTIVNNIVQTNNKTDETEKNIILGNQLMKELEQQLKKIKQEKKANRQKINQFLKKNRVKISENSESDHQFFNKFEDLNKQIDEKNDVESKEKNKTQQKDGDNHEIEQITKKNQIQQIHADIQQGL